MGVKFLLGNVYINGIKASLRDKLEFSKHLRQGRIVLTRCLVFDMVEEPWIEVEYAERVFAKSDR